MNVDQARDPSGRFGRTDGTVADRDVLDYLHLNVDDRRGDPAVDRDDDAQDAAVALFLRERREPGWTEKSIAEHGSMNAYAGVARQNAGRRTFVGGNKRRQSEHRFASQQATVDQTIASTTTSRFDDLDDSDMWRALSAAYDVPDVNRGVYREEQAAQIRATLNEIGGLDAAFEAWDNDTITDKQRVLLFAPWSETSDKRFASQAWTKRASPPPPEQQAALVALLRRLDPHRREAAYQGAVAAGTELWFRNRRNKTGGNRRVQRTTP
jgi:hypothetical protein